MSPRPVDDVPDHIKQLLKEQEADKLAELKSPSEDGRCILFCVKKKPFSFCSFERRCLRSSNL